MAETENITAILGRLNAYDGENIWEDVVRQLDEYDDRLTGLLDPGYQSSLIVLTDGNLVGWNPMVGRWVADTREIVIRVVAENEPGLLVLEIPTAAKTTEGESLAGRWSMRHSPKSRTVGIAGDGGANAGDAAHDGPERVVAIKASRVNAAPYFNSGQCLQINTVFWSDGDRRGVGAQIVPIERVKEAE